MTREASSRKRSKRIDREIDENLKRAFDELANEPIPDRFTELLDQLRSGTAHPKTDSGRGSND
ncbi:NepR family anti-sigma factor [Ruegeria sp. HKCCSP351]|uniref:NepR family anti-sigma factor n=1 Tax=Ruegeria sp. HKCCSP351 TaxID=2794832 RepID=UPI001AE5B836|nr:NepR family anti-sigma factor [Ruegeria sp. HKCCSP351]